MNDRENTTGITRHRLMGLPLDSGRLDAMTRRVLELAGEDSPSFVTYLNPDCVNLAFRDADLPGLYEKFDIILVDGIGVVWAAQRNGIDIPERAAITDMFPELIRESEARGLKVFFLGAKPGIADRMAEKLKEKHPNLRVVGFRDGYFTQQDEKDILGAIRDAAPDFLFVAMGTPLQERWVVENAGEINAKLTMCCGGVFDFYSGAVSRAPEWMIRMHIEWFHRLIKDPARLWKRYLIGNVQFIMKVLMKKEVGR